MASFREKAEKEWLKLINPVKPQIFIGMATCGEASGASSIYKAIESALINNHINADIHKTGCLGMCYYEPIVDIIKPGSPRISYNVPDADTAYCLIKDYLASDNPRTDLAIGAWGEESYGISDLFELDFMKNQKRVVLKNVGIIDPEDISHYIARGGYKGLEQALRLTPEEIIEIVGKSGLRGLGGAGYPTASKWKLCLNAKNSPKYLVCNADEGDPGAYMDRSLLESDPHIVLEGMLIGAYAVNCNRGFIYIRAEYPLAIKRVKVALEQMRQFNFLGKNILGSDFSFDIEIREGAGAFVCGEETALIASIEGKRGTPYIRPPYPSESGISGKPTLINNVKTFANIPSIIANKEAVGSKGTVVFALTGKVANRGLIEVPIGMKLREIIYEIGGGIPDGRLFKAVQTGGPSGGCLPAALLDLQVDFDSLTSFGSIMGSGGMVVLDEDTCMVDVARFFLAFNMKESCGKCLPCSLGTRQMSNILNDITHGKGKPSDIDTLIELSQSVKHTSLCGLGRTSPNPILTTIRYFRNEYEAHINERRCPAGTCKAIGIGEPVNE
jgi:NADH:ubiquinone oxidoreductase subunit F (NADH-binding)